jgi:hypothetical protein
VRPRSSRTPRRPMPRRYLRFVEPPWDYRVEDGEVVLDVMGQVSRFPLRAGPDR